MIQVDALDFGYQADRLVLQHIDLQIAPGDIISLIGPNGCGKSTFLQLVRGNLSPDSGRIRWNGRDPRRISRRDMARECAVLTQFPRPLFGFSVEQLIAMARFAHRTHAGLIGHNERQLLENCMRTTDCLHLRTQQVTTLSGGELQRVYLARALAQQAPVLLLDEPTSHMDLDHRWETARILRQLNREQGTTIIQVSHDLDLAASLSDRLVLLDAQGRLIAADCPERACTPENLARIFSTPLAVDTNPHMGTPRVSPLAQALEHPPRDHRAVIS